MMLQSREAFHPIFQLPQKKLFGLYGKWTQGGLTEIDSYLLYLALFKSTDQVQFSVPAMRTEKTNSIVSGQIPRLVETVSKITAIRDYHHSVAQISINADTKDLANSHIWIDIWNANYQDYQDNYHNQKIAASIKQREERLQVLIKDSNKDISRYAHLLAKWAAESGSFPTFQVSNPISNRQCTLSEYWQEIIAMCCKEDRIFLIPKADLDELIEHCEEYVPAGSIYSYTLSNLLKSGHYKQKNYLGLGDIDITGSPYRILAAETSIEDANKLAMIDSAPKEAPREANYPSKIAYLRAKVKFDMATEYHRIQAEASAKMESINALVDQDEADNKDEDTDDLSGVNI